ncbi:hypothetical protein VP01_5136g1, partial [Puccinia sorghi]
EKKKERKKKKKKRRHSELLTGPARRYLKLRFIKRSWKGVRTKDLRVSSWIFIRCRLAGKSRPGRVCIKCGPTVPRAGMVTVLPALKSRWCGGTSPRARALKFLQPLEHFWTFKFGRTQPSSGSCISFSQTQCLSVGSGSPPAGRLPPARYTAKQWQATTSLHSIRMVWAHPNKLECTTLVFDPFLWSGDASIHLTSSHLGLYYIYLGERERCGIVRCRVLLIKHRAEIVLHSSTLNGLKQVPPNYTIVVGISSPLYRYTPGHNKNDLHIASHHEGATNQKDTSWLLCRQRTLNRNKLSNCRVMGIFMITTCPLENLLLCVKYTPKASLAQCHPGLGVCPVGLCDQPGLASHLGTQPSTAWPNPTSWPISAPAELGCRNTQSSHGKY